MSTGEKKQKIQWDEETIAEHDKERGSRFVCFFHYAMLYAVVTFHLQRFIFN
jgi:hypothetical protein